MTIEKHELLKKLDKLEKKLDIAVKALKEYAKKENWNNCNTGRFGGIPTVWFKSAYKKEHYGYDEAEEALKQIKEIK